jgi:L-ascorbate metabolism protein UlaG (beta-lactamase superfamily)
MTEVELVDLERVSRKLAEQVMWFGQSGILITTDAGKRIYLDPFRLPADPPPADFIFLTHPHGDHFNAKAVEKIRRRGTLIVAPKSMNAIATDALEVGEERSFDGLRVKTFPAYNRRGFPHPRSKGWVGYLLTFDGFSLYHGGDSDAAAEIAGMRPDVAFLPIARFVSFGVQAGVEAARGVGAVLTVPIHYGLLPGTKKNGERFRRAYSGASILIKNVLETL